MQLQSKLSGFRNKVNTLKSTQTYLSTVSICYESTSFPSNLLSNIVRSKYVNCEKMGRNFKVEFFQSYNCQRGVLHVNFNSNLNFFICEV
jgi:hypothetical protein